MKARRWRVNKNSSRKQDDFVGFRSIRSSTFMHHTIKPSITRVPLCGPLMLVIKHHLTGNSCCVRFTRFFGLSRHFHLIIIYLLRQIKQIFIFFYRTITATVCTITLNLKTITALLTSLLAPPWPPSHFYCRFLITNSKIYWMGFSFHYYRHHHAYNILLFSLLSPLQPIPPHFLCFTSPITFLLFSFITINILLSSLLLLINLIVPWSYKAFNLA